MTMKLNKNNFISFRYPYLILDAGVSLRATPFLNHIVTRSERKWSSSDLWEICFIIKKKSVTKPPDCKFNFLMNPHVDWFVSRLVGPAIGRLFGTSVASRRSFFHNFLVTLQCSYGSTCVVQWVPSALSCPTSTPPSCPQKQFVIPRSQ